jgi:tRNA A37 threonylcarbamoyladenosine dehydratase
LARRRGNVEREGGRALRQILGVARGSIVRLGGGSHIAQELVHVGVGHFRLIDPQEIDDSDLNRLVGGIKQDVAAKIPNVDVAKRLIRGAAL